MLTRRSFASALAALPVALVAAPRAALASRHPDIAEISYGLHSNFEPQDGGDAFDIRTSVILIARCWDGLRVGVKVYFRPDLTNIYSPRLAEHLAESAAIEAGLPLIVDRLAERDWLDRVKMAEFLAGDEKRVVLVF